MIRSILFAGLLTSLLVGDAVAGVVNPDISVIGQPLVRITNDPTESARKRAVLDPGEVETVFDAYLNPYAHGTFVLSLGEEGMDLEEGYFQLLRGLPGGLALKGGKYRVGFGRLNPAHPHTYPFADRFHVLASYLPGDESLDETGVSLSERLPAPGDFSLTATADWLQGDTYRVARESSGASNDPIGTSPEAPADRSDEPRPAFVGRLAGFAMVGDRSALEMGLSATEGTNNVAARTRTRVLGADVKAKLWSSASSYLILQGEYLSLDREDAGWDSVTAAYTRTTRRPSGGYLFADYNFKIRYNAGASYERYRQADEDGAWNHATKVFVGYSLMEETTAFRLDWDRLTPSALPGEPDPTPVNTVSLRVIFSMGPHKAHQF